jgi:hypothetical protein
MGSPHESRIGGKLAFCRQREKPGSALIDIMKGRVEQALLRHEHAASGDAFG